MVILTGNPGSRNANLALLVVGTGLIGSAIIGAARKTFQGKCVLENFPVDWKDNDPLQGPLRDIEYFIDGTNINGVRDAAEDIRALRIIWAAGRLGFNARAGEVDIEYKLFEKVVAFAEAVSTRVPGLEVDLHLISSAGALFEGQRAVNLQSTPAPRRPYGWLKLRQEQRVQSSSMSMRNYIYRVSTAYGVPEANVRRGLVSTLIVNGIRGDETTIYGRPNTMRDFIWASDVGEFVVRRCVKRCPQYANRTELVATGRPATLIELQSIIEDVLRKRLYVTFSAVGSNAADITFANPGIPTELKTSDLRTNITTMYDRVLSTLTP